MPKATRRSALWPADIELGAVAAPEECTESPRSLVLEHREHGLTATTHTFETSLREDVERQFDGITWPPDVRPGVYATVTWQAGKDVVVRTTPLDEPLRVDGVDYFHEYDPRVVTRSFDDTGSNRAKVLHAVRREGRVFSDGSAVLATAGLAVRCGLGRGARGTFLLTNAVDQLIREGYLTRVEGSLDPAGYPSYPAVVGQKVAEMLFYAPLVEPAPCPGEDDDEGREHLVGAFVRKLPPGAQPSEKQLTLHERAVETAEVVDSPLAPGYTFVKKHHRH